jgi:hypothetical protein
VTEPLQARASALVEVLQNAGPIEYATAAVTLAVVLLGAYVGYQAYRGYRRNDDRAVLFLGIGITLVATGRPVAPTLGYLLVPSAELALAGLSFGLSIAGLLAILYAFTRA